MKTLFVLASVMLVLFLAVPNKVEGQKRKAATRIIEGTISSYDCGDNCYLTIIDKNGKDHKGLCTAPICSKWNREVMMPDSYKGKSVRVTIGKGTLLTGAGDVAGTMDAFTRVQFIESEPIIAQERKATDKANQNVTAAEPGFYITLSRPRAFTLGTLAPDARLTLRSRGFSAFYGNPVYDNSYENIEFVEKVSLEGPNPVLADLFVGPFQTKAAAQRVVSEIPSILRKQIAVDERMNPREFPPGKTMGFYQVEIVRVLSDKIMGNFASLPPEGFLIQPGIGVGRVLIGNSRSEVLAVLGKPRNAEKDADSWESGYESLTVRYRNGAVYQVGVRSTKFHTANSITMAVSSQVFLKAFPKRVKYCCEPIGANVSYIFTYWDASTEGIALKKRRWLEGIGSKDPNVALIIHRVNEAVVTEDRCKRCL